MNITTFWQLIDKTREAADNVGVFHAILLAEELSKLPESEIIAFHKILAELVHRAYRADIWEVAIIIEVKCWDDDFIDFRSWLISQGQKVYEATLANPDNLADYITRNTVTLVEELCTVALNAYQRKTRQELPEPEIPYTEVIIEFSEPETWQAKYPKLSAMFQNDREYPHMDMTTFWQLIQTTRDASSDDGGIQTQLLVRELARMSEEAILDYDVILSELQIEANNHALWDVAYIIGGGCSDDGFTDFRAWLVAQGKAIYELALENPDNLAAVVDEDTQTQLEDLNYVANKAFKRKTGHEMPLVTGSFTYHRATGESSDEHELKVKYPKTWAKFGAR